MSRRRGWEDAYLDYQSLRLLLTQIETVYEEEDYKKQRSRGNITNANNNAAAGGGGSSDELYYADDFIDVEDGQHEDEESVVEDEEDTEGGDGWMGLFHGAIRNIVGTKKKKRKRRRRYTRRRIIQNNDDGGPNSNNNTNSNWVSTDYFDYSPEHNNHHYHRKRKKDSTPKNRALDKGGWGRRYEEGMTDYRDELFLVSDEDVAYGIYDDDEGEWVDEDDEEEDNIHDNDVVGGEYYGNNNNGAIGDQYDSNNLESGNDEINNAIDRKERSISIDNNDGARSDMIRNPEFDRSNLEEEDTMPLLCHSPSGAGSRKQKVDLFGSSMSGLLQTPDFHAAADNDRRRDEQQHKVQFSDSPGVLEAGYETFATAAARRGYTYSPTLLGDDDNDHSNNNNNTMAAGSPSEQQGG